MKRFVPPPNWPMPPRRNWIPPESWRPDPSWPPAPEGWHFWRDAQGKAVLGPIGRYGAPSRRAAYAGGAALLVFLGVNIWAVMMIGVFGDTPEDPAAITFAAESPTPSAVPTTPHRLPTEAATTRPARRATRAVTTNTVTTNTATTSTATTSTKAKARPIRTTTTPTNRATTSTTIRPTGGPTSRATSTNRPTVRPTTTASTREDLLRQYCIDRGIDPIWCDPDTWDRRHR